MHYVWSELLFFLSLSLSAGEVEMKDQTDTTALVSINQILLLLLGIAFIYILTRVVCLHNYLTAATLTIFVDFFGLRSVISKTAPRKETNKEERCPINCQPPGM